MTERLSRQGSRREWHNRVWYDKTNRGRSLQNETSRLRFREDPRGSRYYRALQLGEGTPKPSQWYNGISSWLSLPRCRRLHHLLRGRERMGGRYGAQVSNGVYKRNRTKGAWNQARHLNTFRTTRCYPGRSSLCPSRGARLHLFRKWRGHNPKERATMSPCGNQSNVREVVLFFHFSFYERRRSTGYRYASQDWLGAGDPKHSPYVPRSVHRNTSCHSPNKCNARDWLAYDWANQGRVTYPRRYTLPSDMDNLLAENRHILKKFIDKIALCL